MNGLYLDWKTRIQRQTRGCCSFDWRQLESCVIRSFDQSDLDRRLTCRRDSDQRLVNVKYLETRIKGLLVEETRIKGSLMSNTCRLGHSCCSIVCQSGRLADSFDGTRIKGSSKSKAQQSQRLVQVEGSLFDRSSKWKARRLVRLD